MKHHKTADTYAAIAWVHQWKEQPKPAQETFRYAVSIVEESGALMTADFAMLVEEYGRLLGAQHDENGALAQYKRAIAIRTALLRVADPRFVQGLSRIANLTSSFKAPSYSEALYRRAADIQLTAHTARRVALSQAGLLR